MKRKPSISCRVPGCFGRATRKDQVIHKPGERRDLHFDCEYGHKFDVCLNMMGARLCDC